MGGPEAVLERARLVAALTVALDHVVPTHPDLQYRLVGTGAALLHSVELPAADIDLLVRRRQDVDAFGSALSEFRCLDQPAWLETTRQYYANYEVEGVEVGISTVEVDTAVDTIETMGPGPWEHFVPLACGPLVVPTVCLELRLITELYRNRPERYRPLMEHLRAKGCDVGLLQRGMQNARLPETLQDQVLRKLAAGRGDSAGAG